MLMMKHTGIYNKSKKSIQSRKDAILVLSIGLNILLIVLYFLSLTAIVNNNNNNTSTNGLLLRDGGVLKGTEQVWHGGHPMDIHSGSCWCGSADGYCMCTPNLAIDLIITSGKNDDPEFVWLVRRKDTNQLATMGGFVDVDETIEHAVQRELKEEMGIDLMNQRPKLFGVYSDRRRDNRRRTASAVFVVHFNDESMQHPHAGDDAKETRRIPMKEIEQHSYFADHRTILLDYRNFIRGEKPRLDSAGDFSNDIDRSVCSEIIN